MTLDILHFIDNKGGNAEEIRESQRKRGHPVEIVDEVIQMYADWVKSSVCFGWMRSELMAQCSGLRWQYASQESERGAETDICKEKGILLVSCCMRSYS